MKKLFALPLAALVFAACSEATAPESTADLSARYAKPIKNPPPSPATTLVASFLFNGAIDAQAGAGIGTDTDDESVAGNAADLHYVPNDLSNGFVGRFNNTNTRLILTPANAATKYTVDFDLYVIGSWDGRGKQAQQGSFLANVIDVGYRCTAGGPVTSIFKTTFSNQYTVQQDYPNTYLTGGFKAGTGSSAIDALGYAGHPELSNTPQFRSFGDATYALSFSGANPCGTAAVQFTISTSNPTQQSVIDESWGVDNILVRAQ
jgi:hypothetical protein